MTIDLFKFQEEDVTYLRPVPNVLIANEMGTGKTYEALARDILIRTDSGDLTGPTLIVAPLSVLSSWRDHIEELLGDAGYICSMVDPKQRHKFLTVEAHYYLVHWDVLRLLPDLAKVKWLHVVADEAHRAKNDRAKMTRALKKIKADFKTAMTGTPVINQPQELWSILNWLYRDDFRSKNSFIESYCNYDIDYGRGGSYKVFKGPKNVPELRARLQPFTIRRLKQDVLPDLPEKYYTRIWVDLTPTQKRAYEQMKNDLIAWLGHQEDTPLIAAAAVSRLVRLQQFAMAHMDWEEYPEPKMVKGDWQYGRWHMVEPSSKLDALMEVLSDRGDEQLGVYSQFKQIGSLLAARLDAAGIPYGLITGDQSQPDRELAIKEFWAGNLRVLFGTIKAGGVGIQLQCASTVAFLDRSWSPADNLQAEDRFHRYGQENGVEVIDFMARDTVDRGKDQKLKQKLKWIRQLLDHQED